MPEGFAIAGVESQNIAVRVAGEGQAGIRCQDTCTCTSRAYFVTPADFTGLIVDGFDDAFAPDTVIGACPAVVSICRLDRKSVV